MCSNHADSDQHIAKCGGGPAVGGSCPTTSNGSYHNEYKAAVSCCSDYEKLGGGWTYKQTCNIWSTSEFENNKCEKSSTYKEARCLCEQIGGRLCTEAEIDDECSNYTGCVLGETPVWTSSTVGQRYDYFPGTFSSELYPTIGTPDPDQGYDYYGSGDSSPSIFDCDQVNTNENVLDRRQKSDNLTDREIMLVCKETDGCVGAYKNYNWVFLGAGNCGVGRKPVIVPRNDLEEISTSCSTDSDCVGFDKDGGTYRGEIAGGNLWTSHEETGTFLKVDECGEKGSTWCEDKCVYLGGECFDDETAELFLVTQDVYISSQEAARNLVAAQEYTNVALGKPTSQSATIWEGASSRAVDGNTNGNWGGNSVTHTPENAANPWWEVDLQGSYEISKINLFGRTDCCSDRLRGVVVTVLNGEEEVWSYIHSNQNPPNKLELDVEDSDTDTDFIIGSKVRVSLTPRGTISLAEVEILGRISTSTSQSPADENFRKKHDLLVGALHNSYIEFDISNLNMDGSDHRIFLALYVTLVGKDSNLNVYLASNDLEHRWDEQTMTFNNNPTSDAQQSLNTLDVSEAKVHTWVDVDITDLYQESMMSMTIILRGSDDVFGFSSSEGYGPPKLIVTTGTGVY